MLLIFGVSMAMTRVLVVMRLRSLVPSVNTIDTANEKPTGPVNTHTFREALQRVLAEAQGSFIDVTSGEFYRSVGGATGRGYAMASCCNCLLYTSPSPRD